MSVLLYQQNALLLQSLIAEQLILPIKALLLLQVLYQLEGLVEALQGISELAQIELVFAPEAVLKRICGIALDGLAYDSQALLLPVYVLQLPALAVVGRGKVGVDLVGLILEEDGLFVFAHLHQDVAL